jgi:hypothetical protein
LNLSISAKGLCALMQAARRVVGLVALCLGKIAALQTARPYAISANQLLRPLQAAQRVDGFAASFFVLSLRSKPPYLVDLSKRTRAAS